MKKTIYWLLMVMLLAFSGVIHAQTTPWYGYARTCFNEENWLHKFITFSAQNPNEVQEVSETLPEIWAATYLDGFVWFVTTTKSLCKAPFNEETHTIGSYETVVPLLEQYNLIIDMSYNPIDGMMYYLCQDSQFNSNLKRSSLATPSQIEALGEFNVKLWTLAINSQGQAYGVSYEGGNLYQVNLTDATTTLVGPTGKDVWYTQSMAFDLNTDELYWAQFSTYNDHGFYQVDTQTGLATTLGEISNNGTQLTGLFMIPETTPDPIAEIIDFETGDFSQYPMVNDANHPWIIMEGGSWNSQYCMRSGNQGIPSSTSTIEATAQYENDGFLVFDAQCMGEGSHFDKCCFYIDGEKKFEYGDNVGSIYRSYHYSIPAGTHTFKWEYTKDDSVDPAGDFFAVDNIEMGYGTCCKQPDCIAVETTPSSATVNWNGYSDTYTIRYRPNSNNDWTEVVEGITENTYTIHNLPEGRYVFEVKSDCVGTGDWYSDFFNMESPIIREIYVENYSAPVWGEHPDFEMNVPSNAHYTITSTNWRFVGSNIITMEPSDVFNREDGYYYMSIRFSSASGYTFNPDLTVYFNGANLDYHFGMVEDGGNSYLAYTIDYYLYDPTSVSEQTENIGIWPNPASNTLHLDDAEGKIVRVYDNTGRIVLQERYQGCLDVSTLSTGIYVVSVEGNSMRFMKK